MAAKRSQVLHLAYKNEPICNPANESACEKCGQLGDVYPQALVKYSGQADRISTIDLIGRGVDMDCLKWGSALLKIFAQARIPCVCTCRHTFARGASMHMLANFGHNGSTQQNLLTCLASVLLDAPLCRRHWFQSAAYRVWLMQSDTPCWFRYCQSSGTRRQIR